MVRESDHHHSGGVSLSSIALLQERFRQLQKMKEMRQERELLRTFSESERYSPPPTIIPLEKRQLKTSFSGYEQMLQPPISPPNPHCQLSLSLWPESQTKSADSQGVEAPPSNLPKPLFSTDSAGRQLVCSSPPIFEIESFDVDIDTSLRL